MEEPTLYIILCHSTPMSVFAWEAHLDREKAFKRKDEIAGKNPQSHFSITKTKLVGGPNEES